MWITAIIGIATKFFTCSLSVMYRGKDSEGVLQGGPMYVIREAMPRQLHFLAYLFAVVGMIGCLPALQSNQLVQIVRDLVFIDNGWLGLETDPLFINLACGAALMSLTALVILGGLQRIALVAAAVVPTMTLLYVGAAGVALILNIDEVPAAFRLIFSDAFTGEAAAGGSLMGMMVYGVQRGAFSNEAGMGTESLAHGAARTSEPIREGLVAMMGPVIDTLLICTATALMILVSGAWLENDAVGVTLTAGAFSELLGTAGTLIIFVCVVCFATTTIFTYAFYGTQCTSFVFGALHVQKYRFVYVGFILLASVVSIDAAVSLIDGSFALMAIPTMISALWLAPRVKAAANDYWQRLEKK